MKLLFDGTPKNNKNLPQGYVELAQPINTFMATVRDTLEIWFSHYPKNRRTEFAGRMKLDQSSFDAAVLELVVHEILRGYGGILQLEAALPSRKRPDFHLETPRGNHLWVECTVAQRSADLKGSIRIARRLQEVVNSIDTAPFGLGWTVIRHLSSSPPGENSLRRHVEAFVCKLNNRILNRSVVEGSHVGETIWESHGWKIGLQAFYIPSIDRNDPSIVDGGEENAGVNEENESLPDNDAQKLKSALEGKSDQLKSANGSCVIVFSHTDFVLDNTGESLEFALFGHPTGGNRRDSFFGVAHSSNNQHIAGVLYFPDIKAHRICSKEAAWYYVPHPWSRSPLSEDVFSFARKGTQNSNASLEWSSPNCSINDVLGLPEDWPGIP